MSRYVVGIDLGTTNTALAYVDLHEKITRGGPKLHTLSIPQLMAAGQLGEQELLPSFLYLPGPHDLPPGSIALPWKKDASEVVGVFARSHGAKIPGRQVASAKSWLCHPGVDRTAPLLPWTAPPEVARLSPLDVSARYLRHLVDAWNHLKARDQADRLEVQQVVITVPASFDDVARNLTVDAAKQAGFQNVALLEEPQAAFYAWLGTHSPKEAVKVKPGMRCLVIDVGGGTSDFSLIRAGEENGELTFLRDAVGDHLLLGGDNMDLALARTVEAKLGTGKLSPDQFGNLIQACRAAKEVLLAKSPPESFPVTVVGRGRSVVAGTVSVSITAEELRAAIFDGFFPRVDFQAEPERAGRTGLQEMGLPYVTDPAITRHLAAFIRQHLNEFETEVLQPRKSSKKQSSTIEAILFNGGVFQPQVLQDRLIEVMHPWFDQKGKPWKPLILTSASLDLAVAWGAAYFGWLKQTGGKRIGGGIPRSYYIGVESPPDAIVDSAEPTISALCVVPRRLEEGQEIQLEEPELELTIGRPVIFPLYSSTVRGEDQAGAVLHIAPDQLLQLPPLHTVLRGGKRSGAKSVPVKLSAQITEIGTMELACVSREGNRWRLEFNVRDVLRELAAPQARSETVEPRPVQDVWPEEKMLLAGEKIRDTFLSPPGQSMPKPQELPRLLEAALETPRNDWPTALCRRMWEFLSEVADGRTQGPAHLARWYNLTGFCLRPGFGDPLDRYRVEALWKLISSTASQMTRNPQPAIPEGGADYWIMWRRVAGGLNTALQQVLFARLKPTLLPSNTKPPRKPPVNELAEMWRAAGSLERLDVKTKEALGAELLRQMKQSPVPTYLFWTLTRIGTRKPLYGPLNTIVHPQVVEGWLETLQEFEPVHDSELSNWAFCMAQLARRTGVRAVDVMDSYRENVAALLKSLSVNPAWPAMVEEIQSSESDDQSQLFGDTLPIGLRLAR